MKLEDQVCSLELAKRLKELGVKQESYFYWISDEDENFVVPTGTYDWGDWPGYEKFEPKYSAFTVAELGEMLPVCVGDITGDHFDLVCHLDYPHDWFVKYTHCGDKKPYLWEGLDIHCENNLANGMAEILIRLIEKGIVAPSGG